MELFEKIHSRYYHIIRHILLEASLHPLTRQEIESLARAQGFQESALSIVPKLLDASWPFLKKQPDGRYTSALRHPEAHYAMTVLQKSWLAFLLSDIRISLFLSAQEQQELSAFLKDFPPCCTPEEFHYFDRYSDRDPYESPEYQKNFRTILSALKQTAAGKKQAVFVAYTGKTGNSSTYEVIPKEILYSSRDDKFRVVCIPCFRRRNHHPYCFNMSRIQACTLSKREFSDRYEKNPSDFTYMHTPAPAPVVIEISGQRNSLERCMLHFAQYRKQTEYDKEKQVYYCSIYYDIEDEPQLLIEILSFGPVIRVLSPDSFVQSIRERVKRQHELFYRQI